MDKSIAFNPPPPLEPFNTYTPLRRPGSPLPLVSLDQPLPGMEQVTQGRSIAPDLPLDVVIDDPKLATLGNPMPIPENKEAVEMACGCNTVNLVPKASDQDQQKEQPKRKGKEQQSPSIENLFDYLNDYPDHLFVNPGYINFLSHPTSYPSFPALQRQAQHNHRYQPYDQMMDPGYSVKHFEQFCDVDCSHPCCNNQCKYDSTQCSSYYAQDIDSWTKLIQHKRLYFDGKLPGLVEHPQPWPKEQAYILDDLKQLLDLNAYPLASQAGLVMYDDAGNVFVQKPMVQLIMSPEQWHSFLEKLKDSDSSIRVALDSFAIFWDQWVTLTLGLADPYDTNEKYNQYLTTNLFFDEVLSFLTTQ